MLNTHRSVHSKEAIKVVASLAFLVSCYLSGRIGLLGDAPRTPGYWRSSLSETAAGGGFPAYPPGQLVSVAEDLKDIINRHHLYSVLGNDVSRRLI
jgi:hypothetical protein